jgi:transposase-like protein
MGGAMSSTRRRHSEEFKAKVALEAIKGVQTLGELSSRYKVHPTVITQWKRQLVNRAAEVFSRNGGGSGRSEEELTGPLYEEIGRLKVEVDWLKKKL